MIEVAVIGAYGSAGVAAAEVLADEPDVSLSLIDGGEPGGLCILEGCMPSKDILSAGAHQHDALADPRISGELSVDIDTIVDRKDEHVSSFAEHRAAAVHQLAEQPDVTLYTDHARFVDSHTLAVGGTELTVDYVVIATGSVINIPSIPGIDEVSGWTSKDVLHAQAFPDSGIVLGFGAIGLELVPYLATVGDMDLTVIEHDERPLHNAPPEIGEWVLSYYRDAYGVDIRTETFEKAVRETTSGDVILEVSGQDGHEEIRAESLFLFTGRIPAIERLGVTEAGISPTAGWVKSTLQSRDTAHVFVAGDANGQRPILHMAKEEGYLAAENVLAHTAGVPLEPYDPIPHQVIFSGLGTYPYAHVGTVPAQADPADIVVHRSATDDGVFKVKAVAEGHASLVVAPDGRIKGYQGLHHHADVMAKTMQVLVEQEMDVRDVPDRAFHPTTPEILDGLFREAGTELDT